jgi:hypothetical protein
MGLAHYFSESITHKYRTGLLSFSAGVSITYVFLDLFPQFSVQVLQISRFLFLFVLFGFGLLHVVEKYLYQHARRARLRKELRIEHTITSFCYHLLIGFLLAYMVANFGSINSALFFIPLLLYTLVSTLPLALPKSTVWKIVLASSTLVGTIIGTLVAPYITASIFVSILGFYIGVVSYTVLRHALPYGKKGKPLHFILGSALYALVIVWSWTLQ